MVNQELVKQLLKELEAEYRYPIELLVQSSSPEDKTYRGEIIAGEFYKREALVRRVPDLDQKYVHDVELLEGQYPTLGDLWVKMKKLDLLYSYQRENPSVEEIRQLIKEGMGVTELSHPIAIDINRGLLDATQIHRILGNNNILYLHHQLDAPADGIYDDRTGGGSLAVVDRTKVADISLKLIE